MKFDLHVHSTHSGDSIMSVEDIVGRIVELGFDGFALTNHNTTSGNREAAKLCKKAGLIFIPGIEVSTAEGHLLGLGVKSTIKAATPAEEVIAKIHEQGGLAIAAHPYDFTRHGMGDILRKLPLDGIEIIKDAVNRQAYESQMEGMERGKAPYADERNAKNEKEYEELLSKRNFSGKVFSKETGKEIGDKTKGESEKEKKDNENKNKRGAKKTNETDTAKNSLCLVWNF